MIHRSLGPILFCAALASGCTQTRVVCDDKSAVMRERPLYLSVKRLDDKLPTGYHMLKRGDVMRSGDHYRLSIDVPQRSFVYVVQESADGKRQQLWPSPSAPPTPWDPAARLNLPAGGSFQLEGATGAESIYLVASPAALAPAQLAEEVRNATDPREPGESSMRPPPPPPPPPPPDTELRGKEERSYTCADHRGVIAMRFRFRHE